MSMYYFRKGFSIPLYRGYLVMVLTNDVSRLEGEFGSFGGGCLYAHSGLVSYRGMEGYAMILNFDSNNRKIYHGVISHEAVHLAGMLCKRRGIRLDFDNDEYFAYLVEWIVDQAYSYIGSCGFKIL